MPKIAVNFDEVPNEIPPLDPGIYLLLVEEANLEPTKDQKSEKVVVILKVDDPANPSNGRKIYDHISIKMQTNLKRLALSCGLKPGADGLNIEELVGKHCKARVKTRTYKDLETGEVKETAAIGEYLID